MDHWQRIAAAIEGQPVDRVPVSLWRHFPDDDQDAGKLAAHMVRWQREWDFDLVKFMPSGTYGVEDWGAITEFRGAANGARDVVRPGLARAEDWPKLARLDPRKGVLGAQVEALRLAAPALGSGAPILQTVFSPLTTARKLAGERVFADLRRQPDLLEAGLAIITAVTIDFALASLAAGAHGVFFATQCASYRVLSKAEYARFGRHFDLAFFDALRGRTSLDLLHVHGEDVMFDLLAAYPVHAMNWHDRLTAPALGAGARAFPKLVVGGVEETRTMVAGGAEAIAAEVRDAIAQTGGRRVMIGPGCVLSVATPAAHVRAVVDAARAAS
jgi:uroporphyrinogen decarboxylase